MVFPRSLHSRLHNDTLSQKWGAGRDMDLSRNVTCSQGPLYPQREKDQSKGNKMCYSFLLYKGDAAGAIFIKPPDCAYFWSSHRNHCCFLIILF